MEREAKFRVEDPTMFEQLRQSETLAGFPLTIIGTQQQQNTYYDTADGQLRRHRHMLRLREVDGARIVTLKGEAKIENGIHSREELEVELNGADLTTSVPSGEIGDRLGELLDPGAQLQPLFSLQTRRQRMLAGSSDAPVVELALDESTVQVDEQQITFWEVEAELLPQGSEQDLLSIALALRDNWALTPETTSKYERGLALLAPDTSLTDSPAADTLAEDESSVDAPLEVAIGDEILSVEPTADAPTSETSPPDTQLEVAIGDELLSVEPTADAPTNDASPVSTEPVHKAPKAANPTAEATQPSRKISADDDMVEAARKMLARQVRKIEKYESGVRAGDEIEAVHQMRVATRRMRATLKLSQGLFKQRVLKPFTPMLRRLARALGAVRDRDVFIEHINAYRAKLPPEQQGDLDPLVAHLRQEQRSAHNALIALLDSKKFAVAYRKLTSFVNSPGVGAVAVEMEDHEVVPTRVRHRAGSAIWQHYEELRAYETELEVAPPETLHRMRITGKRLRYTLELFEDALESSRYQEVRTRLTALQDHLGAFQDSEVSLAYLRAFAEQHPSEGLSNYITERERERIILLVEFPKVWGKVGGLTFRRRLAEVITQL